MPNFSEHRKNKKNITDHTYMKWECLMTYVNTFYNSATAITVQEYQQETLADLTTPLPYCSKIIA